MHLIATGTPDAELARHLWRFRDPLGRFHLHGVAAQQPAAFLPALSPLEFAGAVVLDPAVQEDVPALLQRSSIEVQEAGAADTVTVTPAGLIGEYNFGRAVGQLLKAAGWDAREARAGILGAGPAVRATARELSSLGVTELAILSDSRPAAEQSAPPLAASTRVITSSWSDPLAERFLTGTDLIVRLDSRISVPTDALGPHLTLLDLGSSEVSRLRSQAIGVGALSFNRRDLEAHLLAISLTQILGGTIDAEPFLTLFHGGVR